MKKIVSMLLALLLLCSLTACTQEEGTPDGMQDVAVENAAFHLYVPASWIPQTESGVSGARVASSDSSNVTVLAYFPSEVMTPAQYWEKMALPEYQNGTLREFKVMEEACGPTTLGGNDAQKYAAMYLFGDTAYQMLQIITVHDNVVYILTYTATSVNYQNHLETVEQIRDVFRFK